MRERVFTILAVIAIALGMAVAVTPGPTGEALAQTNSFYREVQFDAANVITADEAGTGITGFADATLAGFFITCTEDSGTATLDAAIQRSIDGGTTWVDIVAFTQLSATGSQTSLYADVRSASPQMIGNRLRSEFDVTGTGQYTCSVYGAFEA